MSSNKGFAANFLRLRTLFIAFAFLFAQTLSFAHTHDHSSESPTNQTCEVCILAAGDDGDIDISAAQGSDPEIETTFWLQFDRLVLPEPEPAPSDKSAERLIDPPPDANLRPDSARAPPLYI